MAILRIPAMIDPHVHMIDSHLTSWRDLSQAAGRAGYAAIQVMPDLDPPITDSVSLAHYERLARQLSISTYLSAAGTPSNSEQLKSLRSIGAVKVWLGTGPENLIITKEEDLRRILLSTDKVVMIHTEDETTLLQNYDLGGHQLSMACHGQIFDRNVAIRATVKAITAAKETDRRIYLSHISTAEEVELVRAAKNRGWRVFAEVAPHHLFLNDGHLGELGIRAKVNPPLRTATDQKALWQALVDGTIDTVGSDSYGWLLSEKEQPYEQAPTGLPNLELTLPLLLTAVKAGRITLARVIELTSTNPARIFGFPRPTRSLFVDMDNARSIHTTLSDWHPYPFERLVGWPIRQRDDVPANR